MKLKLLIVLLIFIIISLFIICYYTKTYSILKLTGKYGTVGKYCYSNDHDITLYLKLLIILLMVHLLSSNILVMSSELPWNDI